jgi:hypothetical protein
MNFSSDYKKNALDYPVLEILYTNFKRDKVPENFFNIYKYIQEKNKVINTTKDYSSYSIEDHREITFK